MLAIFGGLIALVSAIALFVLGILMLVEAFRESVWWGLAYLFVPFAALVFLIMHWDRVGQYFLYSLALMIPYFMGVFMMGM